MYSRSSWGRPTTSWGSGRADPPRQKPTLSFSTGKTSWGGGSKFKLFTKPKTDEPKVEKAQEKPKEEVPEEPENFDDELCCAVPYYDE